MALPAFAAIFARPVHADLADVSPAMGALSIWGFTKRLPSNHKFHHHLEETMNYLCLVYSDESNLHSLPESPKDAECLAYAGSLQDSGHMVAGEALESVRTATTVRVRNGKVSITDGPFAETKEQLAGFYLIDARDLNEAIQIAAKIPPARVGSIEVRPIRQLAGSNRVAQAR